MPLKTRIALQMVMILTGKNAWYAGIAHHHSPTRRDLEDQFFGKGGPEWFARQVDTLRLPAPPVILALTAPVPV